MRLLPNMHVFAPSDPVITEKLAGYTLNCNHASYIRMDKLAPPPLFPDGSEAEIDIGKGFRAAGKRRRRIANWMRKYVSHGGTSGR